MTITFMDAHLETLTKLYALARKHNMFIRFGTYHSETDESFVDELENFIGKFDEKIKETLKDNYKEIFIRGSKYSIDKIWFELYDPNKKERHVMTYIEEEICCFIRDDYYSHMGGTIKEIGKIIEFIEKHINTEYRAIAITNSPTIIRGFGNKEKIENWQVYREGIALHVFTELVCNYLKEPMIKNIY